MRLFVALELPDDVRREVKRRLAGVRGRLPRARWVDPDIVHLTLLFLGETAAERVPALAAALADACRLPAFAVRLAGGGTFPPGRPARVAWVGLEEWSGEAGSLAALQAAVTRAAVEAIGFVPEGRPFTAHVTLARCPDPWPRDAAQMWATAFAGEIGPPFPVARAVLLESKLSPRGPQYREVAALPLAAAEAGA